MGRARANTSEDGFTTVFGSKRGLTDFERSRREEREREREIKACALNIRSQFPSIGSELSDILAQAFVEKIPLKSAIFRIQQIIAAAVGFRESTNIISELSEIVASGDPPTLPGITAPAISALAQHLASADPLASSYHGYYPIDLCFGRRQRHDLAHYERLQELIDAIGIFLHNRTDKSVASTDKISELFAVTATALEIAPATALAKELSSWIDACALRMDACPVKSMNENLAFKSILVVQTGSSKGPSERALARTALAPLIKAYNRHL